MQTLVFRTLRAAERLCQRLQGKGYGGRATIAAEVRAATRFLPASEAVVFDVGAHAGEWTLALLEAAGSRIQAVHAFEPSAHHQAALAAIADERVRPLPLALGEAAGERVLFADRAGSGLASFYARRLDHFGIAMGEREMVRVTTLDAFMAEHGIPKIDFLKLDVEGHELAALEGAGRALASGAIRALSFEFGGCNIDSRTYVQDFWYTLGGFGYRLYIVNPLFGVSPLEAYDERHEVFRTTTYIAALDQPR